MKVKNTKKVINFALLILMLCTVLLSGCVIKGTIDKNLYCTNLDSNNRMTIEITKNEENYYVGKIMCSVTNTSDIDYTNVTIKFAVYDKNRNLITQVQQTLGNIGHAGSTEQEEAGASTVEVEIKFKTKALKEYNLENSFCELTYLAGWTGL